ncbi:MAG: hypothetical protein JWO22_981 [Frankiales bacterium]|nr:hypothetical protein [Frankiales bacterium]
MLALSAWGHPGDVTHHLAHLVMMLVPFAVFAGVLGVQWRLSSDVALPAPVWAMVGGTAGAGAIHGAMTGHHLHEAPLLGWAMAAMCVGQLGWCLWVLFAPSARLVEIGVLGNLAVVVLWAWTRLVGLPFGVAGGLRQRIGPWDLTCTLLEVGAVLLALGWLSGLRLAVPHPRRAVPA